ncbi:MULTISPECIES: helix-turn-helix domain-containing protein [unclassified Microbacterium]|uniref:helix-turn-helix transcriptional regulator n=1 Tax=unclassified Microbacterium TaxID=2609290 RepID=UPI00214B1693|nr:MULTISPECIES: helix-turn-helix domain-containing protein [unclassified Microbacterium]MCR2784076.1 helix-turn-helix domain-containing protein [Microbacterium sp. zg.B96]MDL5351006.1 helix-turn-helix domain-containing protein [Microbacterium sp. zg-YB36]WIM15084.1 helix-turn-helix domain-containing protein [Microbacterium sp. zg-B96]
MATHSQDTLALDLPPLATRQQVAEYTQISVPTLARWAMHEEGPKVTKIGRACRYKKADVLAWIDGLAETC